MSSFCSSKHVLTLHWGSLQALTKGDVGHLNTHGVLPGLAKARMVGRYHEGYAQ